MSGSKLQYRARARYLVYGLNRLLPGVLLYLLAGVVPAQGPTYGLGRMATEQEIKSWDIAVGPDGEELPPGRGTALEGRKVYAQHCAVCHGPTASEVMYPGGYPPPLVRSDDSPVTGHHLKSVTNYWPYATTVWDYINRAMPMTTRFPGAITFVPGSLSAPVLSTDDVYAVTAFLLYQGGIIEEDEVMDADSLPKVRMPNRDGFVPTDPANWYPRMHPDPHLGQTKPRS